MGKKCIVCGKKIGMFQTKVECHEKRCDVAMHIDCFKNAGAGLEKLKYCKDHKTIYCDNHKCYCVIAREKVTENLHIEMEKEKVEKTVESNVETQVVKSKNGTLIAFSSRTLQDQLNDMEELEEGADGNPVYELIPETINSQNIIYRKKKVKQ